MNGGSLMFWSYIIVAIILIAVIFGVFRKLKRNKYQKELDSLEKEKNLITSIPVLSELSKIETIVKNEKLEERFNDWHDRFESIKGERVSKISDMILELDYLVEQKDYKSATYKIAKIELEIYRVRTKADVLLNEIKEITLSEEKNRNTITKLRAIYREIVQKFNKQKLNYGDIAKSIELQFENMDKRFQEFEKCMENNEYEDVIYIVKALDDMIGHMTLIVEETPEIILMATSLIPKKIEDVETIYKRMTRDGYPLDYLNIEYNITEVNKKINNIIDKIRVLNLEDSTFELKTMLDYFDSLFNDFEKEKLSKNAFEENVEALKKKINKVNKVVNDIYLQLDDIKYSYDLSDAEIEKIDSINKELLIINSNFKDLSENSKKKTIAYSKLTKELELLSIELNELEDKLDQRLQSIGSMHEDELRAREQLEDIKVLLNKSKKKIREYKLPVIPNNYYIQLQEASESIKNIVTELDKKPIAIKILNIRVDTARDLVLKLYNTTNEMIKTALMAEMAVVYGNRYRSLKIQVEQGLNNAEMLFNKGSYKQSLETSINTIDLVEPGIYQRLLNVYGNEKMQ